MRTVHFELLRPGEIVAERDRCPLVYLPLGPLEWHSLHLPVGTDPLNAAHVAEQLAGRIGGVVLPTFYWGTERERSARENRNLGFEEDDYVVGMDFPNHLIKSLYCRQESLALLIREAFNGLIQLKYKLIVIVNGHGALNHVETLQRLCKEFTGESPARCLLANAWITEPFAGFEMSHAEVIETSEMMALHGDCVDMTQLPPTSEPLRNIDYGIVDGPTWQDHPTPDHTVRPEADPRLHASAEIGRGFLRQTVDQLERTVQAALSSLGLSPPAASR